MGRINSSHQFRKSSFPRITFFLPQPHAACVCIANRRVIGIAGAPRIFTLIGLLCGKFFSISSLEANVCPASSPFDGSDTGRPCGCGDSRGHRVPRHGVRTTNKITSKRRSVQSYGVRGWSTWIHRGLIAGYTAVPPACVGKRVCRVPGRPADS